MSIGEILDRAISTYVRWYLPLFVILAIAVIPVMLLQLAATPGLTHMGDVFARMNRLPVGDLERTRLLSEAFRSIDGGSIFAIFIMWPLILFPLTRNALYTYAEGALENVPVSIVAAFRASIARWVAQIVVVLGYFAIALVIGLLAFVLFISIAALVFGGAGRGTGAGVALLIVAMPFVLAFWLGFALLNVAFELSSVSVALEESNPVRAMGNGWRRTFDRALRRRTIGIALAFSAVELGGSLALFVLGALLESLTHLSLLPAVVSAIGHIVISGVLGVFVVVYARDVRSRREGYDLLRAAAIPVLASLGSGDEAADGAADDGLAREDRVLIEQYLARRASLEGNAAHAIATAIAARIRPKLRASFHYLDDVSLIEHIARSRR